MDREFYSLKMMQKETRDQGFLLDLLQNSIWPRIELHNPVLKRKVANLVRLFDNRNPDLILRVGRIRVQVNLDIRRAAVLVA